VAPHAPSTDTGAEGEVAGADEDNVLGTTEDVAALSVPVGVGDTERDCTEEDALSHLPNPA
jgi:hypothetical protein